jgi:hypothetical protein
MTSTGEAVKTGAGAVGETSGRPDLPDEVVGVILALVLAAERDPEHEKGDEKDENDGWRQAAATAVGGRAGQACRAALTDLAAQPRSERARTISGWINRVSAPVPEGIEHIHPSWLREALEGEETEVLVALVEGMPEGVQAVAREIIEGRGQVWDDKPGDNTADKPGDKTAEGIAELRRGVFAGLGRTASTGAAAAVGGLEWVCEVGAALLGASLAGAPPEVLARAAARAGGGSMGDRVVAAARGAVPAVERQQAREMVGAAAALGADGAPGPTEAVGLVSLAHHLMGDLPSVVRAIAQRLPVTLGRALLDQHARVVDMIDRG